MRRAVGCLVAALTGLAAPLAAGPPDDRPPAAPAHGDVQDGGAEAPDPVDWPRTWDALGALEAMVPGAPGSQERANELAELARDAAGSPRGTLLRARLDAWAGQPHGPVARELAQVSLADLTPRETWLAAEILPGGPARVRAVLDAMQATPELARDELLLAWNISVEEARALRLTEGALPIQSALHERNQADWSAMDLGLTLARLGDREGLDATLGEAIARARAAGSPVADLWSVWGTATAGFGDTERAMDYLGRALAHGSSDAGLVLGLMDLEAGRLAAARRGFRPSILSEPPAAWALRGWGMTLLPEATTHAAGATEQP